MNNIFCGGCGRSLNFGEVHTCTGMWKLSAVASYADPNASRIYDVINRSVDKRRAGPLAYSSCGEPLGRMT